MSMIKYLFVAVFLILVASEGRKIDGLKKILGILEQKFGFQVYEDTLMKAEMNNLKSMVADIAENISYIIKDDEDDMTDKANKPAESAEVRTEMADIKQNLNKIVQTTVLLLDAFKREKEERIKQELEIDNLKKSENVQKINFKMLNKSLENTQIDLKTQKETYKTDKEGMIKDIDDLNTYRKMMEESQIKLKVDKNENEISKISGMYDKISNIIETKHKMVLKQITELSENMQDVHVSFSVRLSKNIEDLGPWKTLVFDHIIINDGNAYSRSTGIFKAPVSGVYVFYVHILAADRSLEMCLQHNGVNKLWMYAHGSSLGADGNEVVLRLKADDEVKVVKHGPWGHAPFYVHNTWSTFSGYLIYQI